MQIGTADFALSMDFVLFARGQIVSGYRLLGGIFDGSSVVAREQRRSTGNLIAEHVRIADRNLRALQRR